MGRTFFSMSDAWSKNEARVRKLYEEEGRFEGHESAPEIETVDSRGRKVRLKKDATIGVDGFDIHVGGDKVSVLKEERDRHTGDITLYMQNERGGTLAQRWEKVGEGRYRSAEKPRRVYGI